MSINDAFIKVYRRDDAAPTVPPPSREPAVAQGSSAWPSTVEIAAANVSSMSALEPAPSQAAALQTSTISIEPRPATRRPTPPAASTEPVIGKRPLSSFASPAPSDVAATTTFRPETVISAFRWPEICRALWDDYGPQYERVAEMLAKASRDGRTLVGITGLHTGDGATTTLLGLAVALAARKSRVVLVDASFRAPALAKLLGVEPQVGWVDVLERGLPVAEAMVRAEHDGLDLLPFAADGRGAGRNVSQWASSLQTSVTAGVLRTAYDVVLLDLGSLLEPDSYASISLLVRNMTIDTALAVTSPLTAEADDVTIAGQLLEEDGCELLGVIENRVKPPANTNL